MKLAILQMSDTPQIESSAVMLRYADYEVKVISKELAVQLDYVGLKDLTLPETAMSYGCDKLDPTIGRASIADMDRADLFCDLKINNFAPLWKNWPRLQERSVYWRVHGGIPEHAIEHRNGRTIDHGDERHPPCPAITACHWYTMSECEGRDRNYTFWPPYPRAADYSHINRLAGPQPSGPPICICHSVLGWGFGPIVDPCIQMGVHFYGMSSPHGKVSHSQVPGLIRDALCMVHTKPADCPGWALYEGLLSGCPIVVPRWMVRMSNMHDLFVDKETCLMFGVPCDDTGRGDPKYDQCVEDIKNALAFLRAEPEEARRIGLNGRKRLLELMWQPDRDGPGFVEYLKRTFPCHPGR